MNTYMNDLQRNHADDPSVRIQCYTSSQKTLSYSSHSWFHWEGLRLWKHSDNCHHNFAPTKQTNIPSRNANIYFLSYVCTQQTTEKNIPSGRSCRRRAWWRPYRFDVIATLLRLGDVFVAVKMCRYLHRNKRRYALSLTDLLGVFRLNRANNNKSICMFKHVLAGWLVCQSDPNNYCEKMWTLVQCSVDCWLHICGRYGKLHGKNVIITWIFITFVVFSLPLTCLYVYTHAVVYTIFILFNGMQKDPPNGGGFGSVEAGVP